MIQQADKEKITRFCKGLSDAEETNYIYSLFAKYKDSNELKYYLMDEWKKYLENNRGKHYDLSYLFDRIEYRMHLVENRGKKTITRKIYRWYSMAAAFLLVPLLIAGGLWFIYNKTKETVVATKKPATYTIHTPLVSRISFSLPDGTSGWLNSGSSLEYQLPFGDNRQVSLRGEAWFDVEHDTSHPFEIFAGESKVKVLGTKFNLNAYPEENYLEVVLEEGKVEFSIPGKSCVTELKPNERLIYNNDSVRIITTEPEKYAAWVEGKLMFRGDPMSEVAKRIARWYNVEVDLVDKDLENDVISGTFQNESLENVLKYMSIASPIYYRIIDPKISDDGTFQKKKVLLYHKKT